MTLRELVNEHPEWLDDDMVVIRADGTFAFVGAAGTVYRTVDDDDNYVIAFDGD